MRQNTLANAIKKGSQNGGPRSICVLDTNALIDAYDFLSLLFERLLDMATQTYLGSRSSRPPFVIVVPYFVLNELDNLKTKERTGFRARAAGNWLENALLKQKRSRSSPSWPREVQLPPEQWPIMAQNKMSAQELGGRTGSVDETLVELCYRLQADTGLSLMFCSGDTNARTRAAAAGVTTFNLKSVLTCIDRIKEANKSPRKDRGGQGTNTSAYAVDGPGLLIEQWAAQLDISESDTSTDFLPTSPPAPLPVLKRQREDESMEDADAVEDDIPTDTRVSKIHLSDVTRAPVASSSKRERTVQPPPSAQQTSGISFVATYSRQPPASAMPPPPPTVGPDLNPHFEFSKARTSAPPPSTAPLKSITPRGIELNPTFTFSKLPANSERSGPPSPSDLNPIFTFSPPKKQRPLPPPPSTVVTNGSGSSRGSTASIHAVPSSSSPSKSSKRSHPYSRSKSKSVVSSGTAVENQKKRKSDERSRGSKSSTPSSASSSSSGVPIHPSSSSSSSVPSAPSAPSASALALREGAKERGKLSSSKRGRSTRDSIWATPSVSPLPPPPPPSSSTPISTSTSISTSNGTPKKRSKKLKLAG